MAAQLHTVVLRDSHPLKVAGHDFFRADFQKTDRGKTVYQAFVCTRMQDSLVSWTFTSLDEKQAGEMAASINSVAFVPVKTQ